MRRLLLPWLLAGCHLIGGADEYTVVVEPGTGGTGAEGGAAGGTSGCMAPDECPGEDSDCSTRTCVGGECGVELAAEGTLCSDGGLVCDGDGACVMCLATDCAPYICQADGLACLTSCAGDGECADGHYCNLATGTCQPDLLDGDLCNDASQCASGFCVDDRCCDTDCAGSCNACDVSGSEGACTVLLAGAAGDVSCAPYVCDGASALCPSSCADETSCTSGNYCDSMMECVADKDLGVDCIVDDECQSAHCVDSVCCNTSCIQPCDACDIGGSEGFCVPKLDGSTDPSCDPYLCNGAIVTCPNFCVVQGDCEADHYCSGVACEAKKPDGDTCSIDLECVNAHCIDGFCCDSTCDDPCAACNVAPSEGTCTTVPDGGSGSPSCTPYVCDGTSTTCPVDCQDDDDCTSGNTCSSMQCIGLKADGGSCSFGSECQSDNCVEGFCCNLPCGDECDTCALSGAEGTCTPRPDGSTGSPSGCGLYLCGGGATCPSSCTNSSDCASTAFCNTSSQCVLKLVVGEQCNGDIECANGACVDGYCCGTACGRVCERCDLTGSEGTCAPSDAGTDPDTECAGVCDGAGACAEGTYDWLVHFGNGLEDIHAQDVAVDDSGNVLVVGRFKSTVNFGGGNVSSAGDRYDAFVLKYNSAGTLIWAKPLGNGAHDQFGEGVAVTSAGEVVVVGRFKGTVDFGNGGVASAGGKYDVFVVKYASGGAFGWLRTIGNGADDQFALDIAIDDSDDVAVVGQFQGTVDFGGGAEASVGGRHDAFVAKYSLANTLDWVNTFGNGAQDQFGDAVAVGPSGEVVIAGRIEGTVNFGNGPVTTVGGNTDAFVVSYDAAGNWEWERTFGNATQSQFAEGAAVDALGNVTVIGRFRDLVDFGAGNEAAVGHHYAFIASYGPTGAYRHARTLGNLTQNTFGQAVAADTAESVVAVGRFRETVDFGEGGVASEGAGKHDAFVAKYDVSSTLLWVNNYGTGTQDQHAEGVAVGPTGGIVVVGRYRDAVDFGDGPVSSAGTTKSDVFVLSLSP